MSHQKSEIDQKFQCDECEYKCSKKGTQEPYRREYYKTKNRRNVTDKTMYVPKRVL